MELIIEIEVSSCTENCRIRWQREKKVANVLLSTAIYLSGPYRDCVLAIETRLLVECQEEYSRGSSGLQTSRQRANVGHLAHDAVMMRNIRPPVRCSAVRVKINNY